MADKQLTKTSWETQAKKASVDEKVLSKALAAYEKADPKDNAAQEEALKAVEKAADGLKKDKAYKAVATYLGEVLTACAKARKALSSEESEEEEGEGEEEAAAYAKDLAKNLKSALNQVKGRSPGEDGATVEEPPKPMKFVAYLAGSKCAVIIAKAVGGGVRKVAASIAGAAGGTYLTGDCIFEKSKHTFVLDTPPGGLAAKLSKALLEETGTKYKVCVRGIDGQEQSDEEGESGESEADQHTGDPNAAKWDAAHAELDAILQRVLAAGHGDVSRFRAAWAMAQEKAANGDFAAALTIAARLLPLVKEADAGKGPSDAQKSIPADVVPFVQARLSWIEARRKLFEEMKRLEAAIHTAIDDDDEFSSFAGSVSSLTDRLAGFDTALETTLEKMVETPEGDARKALKTQAKTTIGSYAALLKDPFFADVDANNGFTNVAVTSTARTALGAIVAVLK